jgi:hypothetical protein
MATYGYSTPYTGRGDTGPLPPGYMEAATAPGRNLAMGIAAMGQGLGKAIEQYRTKKAETEAATQSWETVSGLMQQQLSSDPKYLAIQQYMETGALPQGVTEQDIPRYTQQVQADREMLNKFSALGEKFPDMSLAKKKAALGDAVMVLNQYRTDQQNQVRDAAAKQQLALGALQLGDIQEKRKQNEILTNAIRYGLEQPTSQTVTEQTQVPVSVQYQPEGPFSIAPQQAETSIRPEQIYSEQAPAFRPLQQPQFMRPQGLPGTQPPPSSIPKTWESVLGAKFANQLGTPVKSDLFKPTTAQNQGVTTFETTKEVPVTSEKVVPYEEQSKRLTQFLIQQGAKPETLAMVPQILSMVGQQRPTRVEQVGNIGSVVRFGDKELFVPAKEANLENILKVRGLTVDFPEFQGQANTESEAKDFREQYATNMKLREQITDLLELTKLGKTQLQTPQNKAKAQGLSRSIKATMRKEILGEGVVTDRDQEVLDSVIPDPTVLFSWPSANRTALESLLSRATSNLNVKAKAYGLQSVSSRTGQAAAAPSGGVLRWNTVTKKLE